MKVKLINYSKMPYDKKFSNGDENEERNLLEQIAYVARVSNPSNQDNTETAEKLVRYLIKNQHWSPLEMVNICLEIETTRDIARQILRHRSFSFQEFSQRYAVADLGFEVRDARLQDTKNRQNSIELPSTIGGENIKERWAGLQRSLLIDVQDAYEWAISHGIAKEQARAVLPEGMTVSRLYMNGTLRSHVHYIDLRTQLSTQKEHREVTLACAKAIEPIFPMIMEFVHNEPKI
jgi:thymidylate synthase (FAD)